ncbi:hypothetical protein DRO21_00755 [archaeon]|nr:MAG: hypothetical protein DRO21_00755 [archaeon]HDM23435.1 energy-coupling factor transporter transmembrane protein EcfT [Candidatus Bathyarchaeota archaeon]
MRVVEYIRRESFVHRLNPLSKLAYTILTLALVFLSTFTEDIIILLIWLAIALCFWRIGKISIRYFMGLVKLLMGIIIFITIIQGFMYRGTTVLFTIGHYKIPGGADIGEFTYEGLMFGIMVSLRVITALSVLPLLTMTTSYMRLMESLTRIKVPFKFSFIFVAGMRSVPLIQETWNTAVEAQKLRAFDIDRMNIFKKAFKAYIPIVTPVVLLLLRKAHDMQIAIETRAFGAPVKRTFMEDISFHREDVIFLAFIISLFILSIYTKLFWSKILWETMTNMLKTVILRILP